MHEFGHVLKLAETQAHVTDCSKIECLIVIFGLFDAMTSAASFAWLPRQRGYNKGRLVLLGVRSPPAPPSPCSLFEEEILHVWIGGLIVHPMV